MNSHDDLILKHRNYAESLARDIWRGLPRHIDFEEIAALAELGLVEAARQFDPQRGVTFSTFAYFRIRGAVFDGLRKMSALPPPVRDHLTRLSGENQVIESVAQSPETDDAEVLAGRFGGAVARLGIVAVLSRGGGGETKAERVDESTPADVAERRDLLARVRRAFAGLPAEYAEIVRLHYFEHKSITECAQLLGRNKSTISRRHDAAIGALRTALEEATPSMPACAANAPPGPWPRPPPS